MKSSHFIAVFVLLSNVALADTENLLPNPDFNVPIKFQVGRSTLPTRTQSLSGMAIVLMGIPDPDQ
jgi:hypothetical protein